MPRTTLFTTFGQPEDVIEIKECSSPVLKPGQVRVRMLAAPVNPADLNFIQGQYGIKPELPAVPGMEGCGEVIESQSEKFNEGDKVIFIKRVGTWAEEVTCTADAVLKIPQNTPTDQAAMLKINPLTAWCLLTQFSELTPGSWVILNAANSGVGCCVIQIAKQLGLRTLCLVRREQPIDYLLGLGADHVMLDNQESIDQIKELTSDEPPAMALNAVGGDSALRLMDALAPQGIHITYGAMGLRSLKVPNRFLIFKRIQLHGFWVTEWIKEQEAKVIEATYALLAQWMIQSNLTQPIDTRFYLTDIHAALVRAKRDQRNGKVLISLCE